MRQKELEIKLQNSIIVYNHHALPLCIFSADKHLLPWIYEHYVEIFSITDSNGYILADFLEFWSPYRIICEEIHMGMGFMNVVNDIVNYVIEALNMEYYVSISLDSYYLPFRKNYLSSHNVSTVLLYGYEMDEKQFLAVGFDKNYNFTKLNIDFGNLELSFKNIKEHYKEFAPWCETEVIEMIKRWDFKTEYPFSLSVFMSKFYNYINSVKNESTVYSRFDIRESVTVNYGLNVYDDLMNHLQGKNPSDYRLLHLLYESKQSIYDRLTYIAEKYSLKDSLQQDIDSYKNSIIKKMGTARMLYIQNYGSTNVERISKNTIKSLNLLIDIK
jgi:hypothetical protein